MTYRARWLIELGDLSSSVFQEKRKREKMEIKAIMTKSSTKSKTPSRSQFLTDKKHCVAGRLMLFSYLKKYWQKNFPFYPFFFDILDARPPSVNGAWIERFSFKRRPLTSLVFHARIVFIWKNFKSLVFPAWIFWLHRYAISDSMHQRKYTFFCLFLFVMNFLWFYANKETAPCMSLGGFRGWLLQKKIN